MKFEIRTIGAAAGLGMLAAASLQPAMADGSLERVKEQGYVVTAVNQELPYAELKSDGAIVGVLPEVVEATLRGGRRRRVPGHHHRLGSDDSRSSGAPIRPRVGRALHQPQAAAERFCSPSPCSATLKGSSPRRAIPPASPVTPSSRQLRR